MQDKESFRIILISETEKEMSREDGRRMELG
jgi:hypothetical protein